MCLLLFLLGAGTFVSSLHNSFVNLDDPVYVYENVHVQQGFTAESIRWAFSSTEGGLWHPLTWLSIMLDCWMFGLRAGGHHLISLFLHSFNSVLLLILLGRLTGSLWRSAFVAALFAVHPLHTESVVWAAERKDVLSAVFFLLTLLAYAAYAKSKARMGSQKPGVRIQERSASSSILHPPSSLIYLLAFFFFALGLMSKPMVVSLPFVLLLLDFWPLGRVQPKVQGSGFRTLVGLFVEKIPFFAAALVLTIITVFAQRSANAIPTEAQFPLGHRLANAILSWARYPVQMLWPTRLAVWYPYPASFSIWPVTGLALLGIALSIAVWRAAFRFPYLAFGWTWYVVTLLPVIGIVQTGGQSHADRYTYLPLIGLFIIIAWGAHDLAKGWKWPASAVTAAATLVIMSCVILAARQTRYWKDSETLFRKALAVTRDNELAQNNLGAALAAKGRTDEAIDHWQEAVRLMPESAEAQNNLGAALGKQGRLLEALPHLQEAVRLSPANPGARGNFGDALLKSGKPNEAISQYQKAIELAPNDPVFHLNLGHALLATGNFAEAMVQFQESLRLNPQSAPAHNELGLALAMTGNLDPAINHFQTALQLDSHFPEAHCNLGIAMIGKSQLDEAIAHLRTALKLNPNYPEAHCNLGVALGKKGLFEDGVAELREALSLRPGYVDAENNLRAIIALQAQHSAPKP